MKDIKAAAKASHMQKGRAVTGGGYKPRAEGGGVHSDAAMDARQIRSMVKPAALKRADGGMVGGSHKGHKGGAGKSTTVINVNTAPPVPPIAPPVPGLGAMPPRLPTPPIAPPPGLGALGAPGPVPPMRKRGGKV